MMWSHGTWGRGKWRRLRIERLAQALVIAIDTYVHRHLGGLTSTWELFLEAAPVGVLLRHWCGTRWRSTETTRHLSCGIARVTLRGKRRSLWAFLKFERRKGGRRRSRELRLRWRELRSRDRIDLPLCIPRLSCERDDAYDIRTNDAEMQALVERVEDLQMEDCYVEPTVGNHVW